MKELTVVVQGAISSEMTPKCLNSIRKFLPESYVILSTWKGSDVTGLDFDEVIYNDDPGAIARMYEPKRNIGDNLNNINRQIVSTYNGLLQVKTKYTLKTRTDFEIRNTHFLDYLNKYNKYNDEMKVFENRVLALMGNKSSFIPFFIYDFLFCGLTSDLKYLFDIPLMTKEEAEWFLKHEPKNEQKYQYVQGMFRYIPEQHIWLNCLKKKFPQILDNVYDHSDVNDENIILSEKALVNNFVCLHYYQYGIYPLKVSLKWTYAKKTEFMFSHIGWLKLYKKYCDKNFSTLKYLYFYLMEKADCCKCKIIKDYDYLTIKPRKFIKMCKAIVRLPISYIVLYMYILIGKIFKFLSFQ